jgi:hypothetical protein
MCKDVIPPPAEPLNPSLLFPNPGKFRLKIMQESDNHSYSGKRNKANRFFISDIFHQTATISQKILIWIAFVIDSSNFEINYMPSV